MPADQDAAWLRHLAASNLRPNSKALVRIADRLDVQAREIETLKMFSKLEATHEIDGLNDELLRVAERVREACAQKAAWADSYDEACKLIRAIDIAALIGEREES